MMMMPSSTSAVRASLVRMRVPAASARRLLLPRQFSGSSISNSISSRPRASSSFLTPAAARRRRGSSSSSALLTPWRTYTGDGHGNSVNSSSSSITHRWLSTSTTEEESKKDKKKDEEEAAESSTVPPKELPSNEKRPAPELLEFRAETRQLLDIVTHSLYTDKEVFLRELVSNASDSLEKLRHLQASNASALALDPSESDVPLEIRIDLDEVTSTITITDTGIGMARDEMIENLGTIARSGSKEFLEQLTRTESGEDALDPARGIIGKFGVGFYSAFMVGETVEVRSRSALADNADQLPQVWTSKGEGTFEIADLTDPEVRQDRGTSIVIHLKSEHWDYVDENRIEKILKRYSNFVNFPIYLNGTRVNTLEAIWAKDPKEVSDDEYSAFYKYVANAIDEPLDVYHFRVDAPLDVKALLFVPSFHGEKYGMGRMEPGVALYCRKVLIEAKSPDILPEWMRFVKGVVDSEDLPLSISRERAQDTALVGKLRRALVRKFIAHLTKMVKTDRSKFIDEFYKEYSFFLKEGICQDYEWQAGLSKLLYFETSKNIETDLKSLDEYISSMRPEQKAIYYLVAPSRDAAVHSPYLEAFEKAGVEVLFLFTAIDDFVMANLEEYEGRKLVSVEKGDIDLSELTGGDDALDKDADDDADGADKLYEAKRELTTAESVFLCEWFRKQVGEDKVASCTVTKRLSTSPAIVTDNESGAMRRMMRLVDTSEGSRDHIPLPKQHVEINPKHAVVVGIHDLIKTEPTLARVLADQIYDNCLVAAGLLDDSRSMIPRLNDILLCVVKGATKDSPAPAEKSAATDESSPSSAKEASDDPSTTTTAGGSDDVIKL